ncbi:MAG: YdcF family protein, partial [bacterium]
RSDIIFVVDGQTPLRELEGAALFHDGWAPRIALTLARPRFSEEARRLAGEDPPQAHALRVLRRLAVPETAIVRLDRTVENTRQELRVDFEYARAQGFRRVIIVSSPYHTRRIRIMWDTQYQRAIPAIVRVTRYEPVDPSRWWRSRHALEDVVHEVFGITNFVLGSPLATFDRGG